MTLTSKVTCILIDYNLTASFHVATACPHLEGHIQLSGKHSGVAICGREPGVQQDYPIGAWELVHSLTSKCTKRSQS
jgi:hypothetical protein